MALDFVDRYKEKLNSLYGMLAKSKFSVCENISSDFIRTSEFIGFPEGVFVGEFFEMLFSNMNNVYHDFKVNETEVESIKKEIGNLIQFLISNFPTENPNDKARVYDLMVGTRNAVTEFQVRSYREGERKRRIIRGSLSQAGMPEE